MDASKKMTGGYRGTEGFKNKETVAISIVIATYNAAGHLQKCLDSITKQSFKNIEILIFDGVGTDNTIDIIKANEAHIDYWQSEPDKGIYYVLNTSLDYVKGKWVYFLGSDDVLMDGFSQMAAKMTDERALYYGHCMRKGLKTNEGVATPFRIVKYNVCHQAIFYPACVFEKYKYDTRYVVYADHALNIELWANKTIPKIYHHIAVADYAAEGFSTKTNDKIFRAEKLGFVARKMGWITAVRYLVKKWKIRKKVDKDYF